MVFVLIVAGMGVCMVQLHTSQSRRQEVSIDRKRAIYLAEAGLAEAFLSVAQGKSGNIASADQLALVGDGMYWVEAEQLDGGQVSLTSTGLHGKGRFTVSAVLQRQLDPVASRGIAAATTVIVGEGAVLDGFSSAEGTYASQVDAELGDGSTGKGAKICAGTDVVLEGSSGGGGMMQLVGGGGGDSSPGTTVYGDVMPGPQGSISIGSGVTVTGSTTPAESEVTLPEIEVPDLPDCSSPDTTKSTIQTIVGGEYEFDVLEIPSGKTLPVEGPANIVVSEFVLSSNATLAANTQDGPVTIYVTDRLWFEPGSVVENSTQDPQCLVFMVSADEWQDFDGDRVADAPVDFQPDGELFAFVYAPTVDFELTSATHLIGGVAANSVTIGAGSRVTFDVELRKKEVAVSGLPKLVAWRVADVPNVPVCQSPLDPFSYHQKNGITPIVSADAHEERYVDIRYYDTNGVINGFTGLATNLDWSQVDRIAEVLWDNDAVVDGDDGQEAIVPATFSAKNLVERATKGHAVSVK